MRERDEIFHFYRNIHTCAWCISANQIASERSSRIIICGSNQNLPFLFFELFYRCVSILNSFYFNNYVYPSKTRRRRINSILIIIFSFLISFDFKIYKFNLTVFSFSVHSSDVLESPSRCYTNSYFSVLSDPPSWFYQLTP